MQYRQFGKTGENVSILGFGCMRLPVVGNQPEKIDIPKTEAMLNTAFDQGVNYFDTAYTYHKSMEPGVRKGRSEFVLGDIFRGSRRDQIFIATKLPTFFIHEEKELSAILDEQLKALGIETIDFYLAHSLTKRTWDRMLTLGMLEFLQKAKDTGKVRHLGFSFHDDLAAFREIVDAFDWEFAQIQYNYLDVAEQAGTEGLHYAASKGLGMVVMEPLRGGKLVLEQTQDIQDIWRASENDWTLAQRGLNFVWNDPAVSVILSGMSTMEQVQQNIASANAFQAGCLSDAELARYAQVRDLYWSRIAAPCTACQYCMPCPQGVNIPENLNVLNDIAMFGNVGLSKRMYEMLSAGARADHCIQCGLCLSKCPQQIQIPDHMTDLTEKMK